MTLFTTFFLCALPACGAIWSSPANLDESRNPFLLLNRSVEAYGGRAVMLDLTDLRFESEIILHQGTDRIQGWARVVFAPPRRLLSTVRFEGGEEKTVFSNSREQGERINGKATDRDVTPDLEKRRRTLMIHSFFLENDARTVDLVHTADDRGRKCAVLTRKAENETWKLWIDLEKYRIRKVSLLMKAADPASGIHGPLTVEWQYDDFEVMDGRLVPRSSWVLLNDHLFQEGRVTRFALNRGIPEADFSPAPPLDP
jgi:hypothetical protein